MPDTPPTSAAPNALPTVSVVPKGDGFNVFFQREGYPMVTLELESIEALAHVVGRLGGALQAEKNKRVVLTVRFVGGPWDGQTAEVERITAPVFAVGAIGNHYWLDTKSDDAAYHWDGTEWEVKGD